MKNLESKFVEVCFVDIPVYIEDKTIHLLTSSQYSFDEKNDRRELTKYGSFE